jgi:hypothetical protein
LLLPMGRNAGSIKAAAVIIGGYRKGMGLHPILTSRLRTAAMYH